MENKFNLTDEQVNQLPWEEFLEYIDAKAEYMKQYTIPLHWNKIKKNAYLTKAMETTTGSSDNVFKDIDYQKLKTL